MELEKFDKFDRQLRLMVMLTLNRAMSVEDISTELNMSRRSIYRYIETYRQLGFVVKKRNLRYSIDHESPFFQQITDRIHFSNEEGKLLTRLLDCVVDNSSEVRELRKKLYDLYSYEDLANTVKPNPSVKKLVSLFQAIQEERIAVIRQYAVPGSNEKKDFIVEPYLFFPECGEIRCFEVSTGVNKTFKIDRAEDIDVLDLLWANKAQHTPYYSDIFKCSGEQRFPIELRLGPSATNVLIEEFPAAEQYVTLNDDGSNKLAAEVCGYKGVGRFVLGVYDDVEVVGSDEFKAYIQARIRDLAQKAEGEKVQPQQ